MSEQEPISERERDWWTNPYQERFTDAVADIPTVKKDGSLEG